MYVAFDTNFYLNLVARKNTQEVKDLIPVIRDAEIKKGITPMMCSIVAQELLSHLLDSGGGAAYTNACIALYLHTGSDKTYRLLPLPEVQIAKMVFDVEWLQRIGTQQAAGTILYELSTSKDIPTTINKFHKEIQSIHDYIADVEKTLADNVERLFRAYDSTFKLGDQPFKNNKEKKDEFLAYLDSNAYDWDTIIALVYSTAYVLRMQNYPFLPIDDILVRFRQVPYFYAVAMEFRRMYFKLYTQNPINIRLKNNANYIWDEYILASIGNRILNEEIGIVSSDGKMNETVHKFNKSLMIMKKDEYLKYIGLPNLF